MTLSSTARQIIFWLLIVAGALLLYRLVNPSGKNAQPIDLATTIGIRVTSLAFELNCADAAQARQAHDLISWSILH